MPDMTNFDGNVQAADLDKLLVTQDIALGVGRPHRPALVGARTKRLFDLVVGSLLVLFFLPFMLAIALLTRLDGGPAIFRHRRIGADGVPFPCLKFRSMVVDAEARLNELLARDPLARAEWERCQKLADDPRVTVLGNFLRQTSLDELPQLFNVLRGEMSLVGPRPITEAETRRYGAAIAEYYACRPGLTGLWQVSGRSDVDYVRRVRLDAEYARNWSLGQDIRILLRTIHVIVTKNGAY